MEWSSAEGGVRLQPITELTMMTKIIIVIILLFSFNVYAADNYTSHYRLITPSVDDKDWNARLSRDMITIDSVTYHNSRDIAIISADIGDITDDAVGTVGGVVGRMRFISDDGTACFVLIYSPG